MAFPKKLNQYSLLNLFTIIKSFCIFLSLKGLRKNNGRVYCFPSSLTKEY